jgi:acyl-ACP thioesterase
MTQKYGHYDFKVAPFEEDIMGALSWGTLGKLLLRAASYHAGAHGFGFDDVNTKSHAWVLSRLVIDMERMPRINEAYSIESWVTRVYRQFTDRHFDILTPTGDRLGQATSIWALIDIDSRQPLDLSSMENGEFSEAVSERTIPIAAASRVRVKSEQPERCLRALYSDLDINGHVNSIRYIEMVLDLFEPAHLANHPPRRIEMSYCAETYAGEELQIFHDEEASGRHCIEIRKADGLVVVKAAVELF